MFGAEVSHMLHFCIGAQLGKITVISTALKMSVDIVATPALLLLIQQKLRIVQYQYISLSPVPKCLGQFGTKVHVTLQTQN